MEPSCSNLLSLSSFAKGTSFARPLNYLLLTMSIFCRVFCEACHRVEAKDFWKAVTQVRQRSGHKKTFYYLEQILLKNPKITSKCVNIKAMSDGLDFFFDKKDDARKLADFMETIIPCRYKESERLISHDTHSNTYNYKNTFSVEIVPICKDDIVCLPLALARSLGNINQLVIVQRIANWIYLIDPMTLKTAEVPSYMYFKTPFKSIAGVKQLTNYTVMDVEVNYDYKQEKVQVPLIKASATKDDEPDAKKRKVDNQQKNKNGGNKSFGPHSESHLLADVWVVRTSDLGKSEDFIHTKTHLGHLLKPGDSVLGFDVKNSVINNDEFDALMSSKWSESIKDVILVKKIFGDKLERNRRRKWKLRRMNIDKTNAASETASINNEMEDFMRDLEEDPCLRANVNIYKDADRMAVETDDEGSVIGVPRITLQEMLDDLTVGGDADDEEWEDVDDDN